MTRRGWRYSGGKAERVTIEQCPSCDGKGTVWYDPEGHPEVCQRCEGTGVLADPNGEKESSK